MLVTRNIGGLLTPLAAVALGYRALKQKGKWIDVETDFQMNKIIPLKNMGSGGFEVLNDDGYTVLVRAKR